MKYRVFAAILVFLTIGALAPNRTGQGAVNASKIQITHAPLLYANPYESLVISATTNAADADVQYILFYRGVGKKLYESHQMRLSSGNVITGVIPQSAMTPKGVAYFIAVRDSSGNEELLFGSPEKPHIVEGHSVVILKSRDAGIYDDVIQGLRNTIRSNLVSFTLNHEPEAQKALVERLRQRSPEVIVTLGQEAADFVHTQGLQKKSPLVHAMLPEPANGSVKLPHSTGIYLDISTQQVLSSFKTIIPGIRKIGVIYDPSRTERIVQEAKAFSPSLGFQILATRIEDSGELVSTLRAFEKNIDAFWLVPDGTVLREENYPAILEFSRSNRIPLFVFSPELVKKGALASLSPDFESLGNQAGNLVQKILDGGNPAKMPFRNPDRINVTLNMHTAQQLKLEGIAQRIVEYAADNDYPLRVVK